MDDRILIFFVAVLIMLFGAMVGVNISEAQFKEELLSCQKSFSNLIAYNENKNLTCALEKKQMEIEFNTIYYTECLK